MAVISPTSLTRWILTEDEEISGQILSIQQQQVIQNYIAEASEQMLALTFDATDAVKFAQDEAFLAGKLQILKYMLDASETILRAQQEKLAAQRQ